MSSLGYKKLLIFARFVLVVGAVALVAVLIARDVVVSGRMTVSHDFSGQSPFFSELVPKQRVITGDGVTRLIDEPVYTTLSFPRPFQELTLTVRFQNPDGLLLEAGPQTSPVEAYELAALDHPMLNQLFQTDSNWVGATQEIPVLPQQNRLYQRRSAPYLYGSLEQVRNDLPDQQITGYHGLDWPVPYLPSFEESDATTGESDAATSTIINTPLRGGHEFLLATNQPVLQFSFIYQDINNQEGPDDIMVDLKDWQGNIIKSLEIKGDENEADVGQTTAPQTVNFQASDLPVPGVFQVSLQTSQDVFFHEIKTSAPFIVARGRVSLAGGPVYRSEFGSKDFSSAHLFTDARVWTASTSSRETAQPLYIGSEALQLEEPLKDYRYELTPTTFFRKSHGYEIFSELGNVVLEGRGVFAFAQEQYFSPWPWYIDHSIDLQSSDINYVVTDYLPPFQEQSGIRRKEIFLDLSKVYAPEKKLRVKLAAPQLQSQTLLIHEIQAEYNSEPVTWQNASEKLQRFLKREFLTR